MFHPCLAHDLIAHCAFQAVPYFLGLLFTVSLEHLQCLRQAWLTRLSLDGLAHRNPGRSSEISLIDGQQGFLLIPFDAIFSEMPVEQKMENSYLRNLFIELLMNILSWFHLKLKRLLMF